MRIHFIVVEELVKESIHKVLSIEPLMFNVQQCHVVRKDGPGIKVLPLPLHTRAVMLY